MAKHRVTTRQKGPGRPADNGGQGGAQDMGQGGPSSDLEQIAAPLRPLAISIDLVHPDPRNARAHPIPNITAIKNSLQAYGQRKPIVVNRDGTIEAGNATWQAARELGWKHIAVVHVDDGPEAAMAFGIMDNRSGDLAEWNFPVLKDELESLDTGAFNMDNTGFDTAALEALLAAPDWSQPGGPTQAAIDAQDAKNRGAFTGNLAAMVKLLCPDCGHEFQVLAGDILKDTMRDTHT